MNLGVGFQGIMVKGLTGSKVQLRDDYNAALSEPQRCVWAFSVENGAFKMLNAVEIALTREVDSKPTWIAVVSSAGEDLIFLPITSVEPETAAGRVWPMAPGSISFQIGGPQ